VQVVQLVTGTDQFCLCCPALLIPVRATTRSVKDQMIELLLLHDGDTVRRAFLSSYCVS
jgi:hypothetical protein